MPLLTYFATLTNGKTILWCYLIWYLSTLWHHFDPALRLWINSLEISVVVGIGLLLSITRAEGAPRDPWQIARLLLMPFCVPSFATLIKDEPYFFDFPPGVARTRRRARGMRRV